MKNQDGPMYFKGLHNQTTFYGSVWASQMTAGAQIQNFTTEYCPIQRL